MQLLAFAHLCAMNLKRKVAIPVLALAALPLAGCVVKPLRSVEADGTYCFRIGRTFNPTVTCTAAPVPSAEIEAQAKRFESTPDAVTLYVVRRRWDDVAYRVAVTIDTGAPVVTVPVSFFRVRLSPREHEVAFEWQGQKHIKTLSALAGDVVFVELVGDFWFSSVSYRWADADPACSKSRAMRSRMIADVEVLP